MKKTALILFAGASTVSVVRQVSVGWDWADFAGRSLTVFVVCVIAAWALQQRREA